MQGQIQLNSSFGQYIYNICKRNDVNNIVEIGTWNGAGSTKCIYEAIKDTDKQLISLEIDMEMHKQAIDQYKDKSNIKLHLGKINDLFINPEDYGDEFFSDYSRETKRNWLNQDIKNMKNVPNVINLLPEKIDFLILDGGEFTSWNEYLLLKDRSKIIAADDTKIPCFKNVKVREEMLKERKVIIDNQEERNGFIICERI